MNVTADLIVRSLTKKKKELLDELLLQSIQQLVVRPQDLDKFVKNRQRILAGLQQNDISLKLRKEQTGIEAKNQEKKIFQDINQVLHSIKENNTQTVFKLEQEKKELEKERLKLEKENKLSDYINQSKSYRSSTKTEANYHDKKNRIRLLNVTL